MSSWGGVTTAVGLVSVPAALTLDLFPLVGVAAGVGLLSFVVLMMMFGAAEERFTAIRDRAGRR
jgi:hypothetical protein